MTSRCVKTGLGLLALLLPGGLLFLLGWVLVRAVARAWARVRQAPVSTGAPGDGWQAVFGLAFRDVLRETRAAL